MSNVFDPIFLFFVFLGLIMPPHFTEVKPFKKQLFALLKKCVSVLELYRESYQ